MVDFISQAVLMGFGTGVTSLSLFLLVLTNDEETAEFTHWQLAMVTVLGAVITTMANTQL